MTRNWIPVTVSTDAATRAVPRATVGNGRIDINKAAYELVESMGGASYAEILLDSESADVGIRLLKEPSPNAVAIKPKLHNGKHTGGASIASKAHVIEAFGPTAGLKKGSEHFTITRSRTDTDVLVLTR